MQVPHNKDVASDVVPRDVPDLAHHIHHKGPVQTGLEGQRFLGKLLGAAERHKVGRQQGVPDSSVSVWPSHLE